MVAQRIKDIPPSLTIKLTDRVRELRRKGMDVLSFTIGEPDFPTPPHVVEAAIEALREGKTKYAPSQGILPLREAISRLYQERGLDFTEKNILITTAKFALYAALQSLVDPGEEVILPDPCWVSYEPMVMMASGRAVKVRLDPLEEFSFLPEKLKEAVNSRTRILILNTPANPTGGVLRREHLKLIADLAVDHDFYVVADETYEKIVYEGEHISIATLPGMEERTITVSSFSKSYSMPGWRVGWVAAPEEHINDILRVQQHTLTCLPPFVQAGALAALEGPQDYLNEMVKAFRRRRDKVVEGLNNMPGVTLRPPHGTFYAFFHYDQPVPSMDLTETLIEKARVALTPGIAFGEGGEGFMRFSFAVSDEKIEEGLWRMRTFFEENF